MIDHVAAAIASPSRRLRRFLFSDRGFFRHYWRQAAESRVPRSAGLSRPHKIVAEGASARAVVSIVGVIYHPEGDALIGELGDEARSEVERAKHLSC